MMEIKQLMDEKRGAEPMSVDAITPPPSSEEMGERLSLCSAWGRRDALALSNSPVAKVTECLFYSKKGT